MARTGRPPGPSITFTHRWTPEEIAFLRTWRTHDALAELARRFNRRFGTALSVSAVDGACTRYGIRAGWDGRFRPKEEPWNKGIKGYQAGGNAAATQFKPGNKPHTWAPVGTRVKQDSEGYWKVKMADSPGPGLSRLGWAFEHRLIWEAANGPQPKGTAIVFIDGNTDNLSLDNLACVTRAELARLNQLGWRHLRSPEARQAMIAEARLLTQAHRRARELGLTWGQRRRLIPQRAKIVVSEPEATHA